MAFRFDREKLKGSSGLLCLLVILGSALYLVLISVPVTPEFLKSRMKAPTIVSKKIVVDEVIKLPPVPKNLERVVPQASRPQLDRTVRPSMSSSLRGFGEGGLEAGGSFSESGGQTGSRVEDAVLDRQARISRRVEPVFPQSARERGLSGIVTLEIQVLPSGQVGNIKLLESQPSGYFEIAATDAAKKWIFEPAMASGSPVASVVVQKMRFDLE